MRRAFSLVELMIVTLFIGLIGTYIFKFLGYMLLELEYSKYSTQLAKNSFRVMELIKVGVYKDTNHISGFIK